MKLRPFEGYLVFYLSYRYCNGLIMVKSKSTPVLAIDGGGTRCRIASADEAGVVSIETASANVSTDFDGSVREILKGLSQLGERIHAECDDIYMRPAFLGLAGVTGSDIIRRLQDALPFKHIRIADDKPAALRGSLADADGFLAHCGTGSFFGVQLDGHQRFVGGWGPVLGDEASAQWIGRAALSASLESVDQIRQRSSLTDRLLSEFGDAAGIVSFASHAEPVEFGALARHVTEASANDDPVAIEVMRAGAGKVVEALGHLGWRPGMTICLTGGIGPHFERHLPDEMRQSVAAPKSSPLDGAISLAFDLARGLGA